MHACASCRHYNLLWQEVQEQLNALLEEDETLKRTMMFKRTALVSALERQYVRCLLICSKLNTVHDHLKQPQRRALLRTLLDLTLTRQLEIRHEVCALDATDTLHVDHLMNKLHLQPQQLSVTIPTYFYRERQELLAEREAAMIKCLEEAGVASVEEEESFLSVPEAIAIIQRHERARQARNRALHTKALATSKERDRGRGRGVVEKPLSPEAAAVLIQAHVRGGIARALVRKMRHEDKIFLGMESGGTSEEATRVKEKLALTRQQAYRAQQRMKKELESIEAEERNRIIFEEGPQMVTALDEGLREWIFQVKRDTGKFPDFPDEDEGGSAAIDGLLDPLRPRTSEVVKDSSAGLKDREGKDDKSQQHQLDEEEEEQLVAVWQSAVADQLTEACATYRDELQRVTSPLDVWQPVGVGEVGEEVQRTLVVEGEQQHVRDIVRDKVDDLARMQLQKLKEVIEGEKKGTRKKKKSKRGKKNKRKKEKDLTPDRSTESLFEELVINGIVKSVEQHPGLDELSGSPSRVGHRIMVSSGWPSPSYGDFLNTLVEYVALPLGLEYLHDLAEDDSGSGVVSEGVAAAVVRSLLIVGNRGSGKSAALYAVAKSTGALLLDLTATNIVGRYPGKTGQAMMLHLVLKVGRLLQPTIILVDEADRTFLKKVPKTDKSEPRRLRKDLPRLVKAIAPEDRIVLVGISNSPWNCDIKNLTSVYHKVLLCPRPTCSARAALWVHQLQLHGAQISPALDISCLARISDGFTARQLCYVTRQVVSLKKKIATEKSAVLIQDFIPYLAKQEPLYREEEEALNSWFFKTPLMRKRAKLHEELKILKEKKLAAEKAGKGRGKSKKKK
ncbi:ATPase AAA-type core [Trinorchestia longiramus]|nr:ATPase AAA-type core [Trinorchestia longiramus]